MGYRFTARFSCLERERPRSDPRERTWWVRNRGERGGKPRFNATEARCILAGLLLGCTAAPEGETSPPGRPDSPTGGLQIEVVGPMGNLTRATVADSVDLEGLLVGGDATSVTWSTRNGASGTADGLGSWRAHKIPLVPGDNHITVIAQAGPHAARTEIEIHRNSFLLPAGAAALYPYAGFIGEPTEIRVALPIQTHADLDPTTLRLTKRNDSTGDYEKVWPLSDDGDLNKGDEMAGDGVYSARFLLTKQKEGYASYWIAAESKSTQKTEVAWAGQVQFVSHLTQADYDRAIASVNQLQSVFDAHKKKEGIEGAVKAVLAAAASDANVLESGAAEGGYGAWFYLRGGLLGAAMWSPDGMRGNSVSNGTVFAAAGYQSQIASTDEAPAIADLFKQSQCPDYDVDGVFLNLELTLNRLRTITKYGVIVLTTHGSTFFRTLSDGVISALGLASPRAQELLLTGEEATVKTLKKHELGLKTGQLVLSPSDHSGAGQLMISAKFIEALPGTFPGSLVYLGACRSFSSGNLAIAFLKKGARAFLGYSDYVQSDVAFQTGKKFFQCMVKERRTDQSAHTVGDCLTGLSTPLRMAGERDLTVAEVSGLRNGGFESVSPSLAGSGVGDSWIGEGDSHTRQSVGGYHPTSGNWMGMISTGIGYATTPGALRQNFCVPANTHTLSYDWNFISAEFLSYCKDKNYQDRFTATLQVRGEKEPHTIQSIAVADLCDKVVKSLYNIPQTGDLDGTWASGWQHFAGADLSKFVGKAVTLRFEVSDRGDNLYNTAVLLDGVSLQ